ncbi:response regulator [Terriglobus sp.]|uniref:response regulator n=1 Tax=Terriglobus sp. TaxID=1889013 RepID=UPI003B00E81D
MRLNTPHGSNALHIATRGRIRVAIVDDHPAILLGLSSMLSEDEMLEVVGTLRNGLELKRADFRDGADVFLLDLRMPGMSSVECIRLIQERWPSSHILLISSFEVDGEIMQALEAGASGFIGKNADQSEIVAAIRKVHTGAQRLPSVLARRIAEHNQRDALSRRELEVLRGVAKGLTSREIAARMGLSEYTVRNHVNSILSKLQVRDRTEAAVLAIRKGLVPPEE